MNESKLTVADLNPGETARITEIDAPAVVRHRLLDFGLRIGEEVTVIRAAPLSDPIEIRVQGGYLSLRKADARQVQVSRGV